MIKSKKNFNKYLEVCQVLALYKNNIKISGLSWNDRKYQWLLKAFVKCTTTLRKKFDYI